MTLFKKANNKGADQTGRMHRSDWADAQAGRHVKFLKKNAGQRGEQLVFYLKFCARAICQNMYKARLESFQDNV